MIHHTVESQEQLYTYICMALHDAHFEESPYTGRLAPVYDEHGVCNATYILVDKLGARIEVEIDLYDPELSDEHYSERGDKSISIYIEVFPDYENTIKNYGVSCDAMKHGAYLATCMAKILDPYIFDYDVEEDGSTAPYFHCHKTSTGRLYGSYDWECYVFDTEAGERDRIKYHASEVDGNN